MSTPVGFKHSAETRAKMSAAHKKRGFVITAEQREKMVAGQRVAARTPEYRAALARPGRVHSAETRAKMSAAHKGKTKTAEHRAAISAAKKDVPQRLPQTAEQREKNRQAQLGNQRAKGIKHTPEQRAHRGKLTRQMWLDGVFDNKGIPTRGKPGYHNGIRMKCLNSEGVFAQALDHMEVHWLYEPQRFRLSWCTYLPDFYLPEFDIWVEVKGFMTEEAQRKVDTFRRETGKTLTVVFCSELPYRFYQGGEEN